MNYLFLATGFEEVEAITVVDILRRADIEVKTVAVGDKVVVGTHGIPVTADIMIDDVDKDSIDMVILPGGMPGTTNLGNSEKLASILDYAYDNNKWICAICAAPMVLGGRGFLKGRKAVCYPGCEGALTGADISSDCVVVDGKIVTSKGPGTATEFGFKIAELLKGKAISDQVRSDMLLN